MTRSIRIPLVALGAALLVAGIGACGSGQLKFGDPCSVYAATNDCESPNTCQFKSGPTGAGRNAVCTSRCDADKDCPAGTFCLPGVNPVNNQQDNFCFKKDAGL